MKALLPRELTTERYAIKLLGGEEDDEAIVWRDGHTWRGELRIGSCVWIFPPRDYAAKSYQGFATFAEALAEVKKALVTQGYELVLESEPTS